MKKIVRLIIGPIEAYNFDRQLRRLLEYKVDATIFNVNYTNDYHTNKTDQCKILESEESQLKHLCYYFLTL